MCLIINDFREDARLASKPITVYKVLIKEKGNYFTPFMNNKIKIGETLKASQDNAPEYCSEICGQGVHAYKTLAAAKLASITWRSIRNRNTCITEWRIPIGTTYWFGIEESRNELAAREMQFIREIEGVDFPICTLSTCLSAKVTKRMSKFADFYYGKNHVIKPVKNMAPKNAYGYIWTLEHLKKLLPESIKINGIMHKFFYEVKENIGFKEGAFKETLIVGYETDDGIKTITRGGQKFLEPDIFFCLLYEIMFNINNVH